MMKSAPYPPPYPPPHSPEIELRWVERWLGNQSFDLVAQHKRNLRYDSLMLGLLIFGIGMLVLL